MEVMYINIFFNREQLKLARMADLYEYLCSNHPDKIIIQGDSIRLKSNHSISIKRGYSGYTDFSTGEKGNSIDFLIRHLGYSITDAVFSLVDDYIPSYSIPDNYGGEMQCNQKAIVLPAPAEGNYTELFEYLYSRGIPKEIIQNLIDIGLMYQFQTDNHQNIIFVNQERDFAEIHGTGEKSFHGVVKDARKDGFWAFRAGKEPSVAFVCEGAIDAISLYILHQRSGYRDPALYISIGGVAKQSAIDRIKRQICTVLAVDNDLAGNDCRFRNKELPVIIPRQKDWNEDLMALN